MDTSKRMKLEFCSDQDLFECKPKWQALPEIPYMKNNPRNQPEV